MSSTSLAVVLEALTDAVRAARRLDQNVAFTTPQGGKGETSVYLLDQPVTAALELRAALGRLDNAARSPNPEPRSPATCAF